MCFWNIFNGTGGRKTEFQKLNVREKSQLFREFECEVKKSSARGEYLFQNFEKFGVFAAFFLNLAFCFSVLRCYGYNDDPDLIERDSLIETVKTKFQPQFSAFFAGILIALNIYSPWYFQQKVDFTSSFGSPKRKNLKINKLFDFCNQYTIGHYWNWNTSLCA